MRGFACVLLALAGSVAAPPLLLAGDSGARAQYMGGTVAGLPSTGKIAKALDRQLQQAQRAETAHQLHFIANLHHRFA